MQRSTLSERAHNKWWHARTQLERRKESETARRPIRAPPLHPERESEREKVGGMNGNCSHLEAPQTAAVVGSAEVEI